MAWNFKSEICSLVLFIKKIGTLPCCRIMLIKKIKTKVSSTISSILADDLFWKCLPQILRSNVHVKVRRQIGFAREYNQVVQEIFSNLTVLQGPFAGLIYPAAKSRGSALYPKLLGTYENELHPFFEENSGENYRMVVDIGCAEGFYLAGFGRKYRDIPLIGFDPDPEALQLTRELAAANRIEPDRLQLFGGFSADLLAGKLPKRSLVVCDCEGFEETVFEAKNMGLWKDSDLVIECHDFLIPGITRDLAARLSATHVVKIIKEAEAKEKISWPLAALFRRARPQHQLQMINEGRPEKMCWLFAQPLRLKGAT